MKRTAIYLILAMAPAVAQQPRLTNAQVLSQAISGPLEQEFKKIVAAQSTPAWVGYAVAKVPGENNACCWYNDNWGNYRGCMLEGGRPSTAGGNVTPAGPVMLEGPSHVVVLFRAAAGVVERIRVFSLDCELDAGGLPVHWLSGVKPAESIALLEGFVREAGMNERRGNRNAEAAGHAIALHADPAGAAAVDRFLREDQPVWLRKQAVFWSTQYRGDLGIERALKLAKEDKSAEVRSQALFWLAQRAGNKAIGAIQESIDSDPDTKVKEQAVFALTQLPKDEGVPALIQVARTNKNAAVRKRAFFWLGQSKDARAIRYLEEVLTGK